MNITNIIKNVHLDTIYTGQVDFTIGDLMYRLSWYDYINKLVFIRCQQNGYALEDIVTKLDISRITGKCEGLILDDFWFAHMTANSSLTTKELEIAFLMYGYMFNTDKTEQDFKLELTELLK